MLTTAKLCLNDQTKFFFVTRLPFSYNENKKQKKGGNYTKKQEFPCLLAVVLAKLSHVNEDIIFVRKAFLFNGIQLSPTRLNLRPSTGQI